MLYMFNTRTLEVDSYAYRSRGDKDRVRCDAQTAYRARVLTCTTYRPSLTTDCAPPTPHPYYRLCSPI